MNDQIPLFVEDYNEAIRATVQALGLPADERQLSRRQLVALVRVAAVSEPAPGFVCGLLRLELSTGVHILAAFEAMDAGYAPPQPIEPEDEKAALEREFIKASKAFTNLVGRLERAGLRVVA